MYHVVHYHPPCPLPPLVTQALLAEVEARLQRARGAEGPDTVLPSGEQLEAVGARGSGFGP